jgi:anti-sigma-K factor RskA
MRYDRPELRDRLASEYALGTLHGAARRRFERLLETDRALRDAVAEWQERLAPLELALEPVPPSASLLARIEHDIGIAPVKSRSAASSWWQRLFALPQLGMLAAGLVVGIGVATIAPHLLPRGGEETTAQLPQSYAGILSDAQGNATMLVSSLRHGRIADIKVLRPLPTNPDRKLFLWAIPAEGAPFLVGEVPASGKASLKLSATSEELFFKVTTLAVSSEPASGVPSKPSEFLLKGPCAKFW